MMVEMWYIAVYVISVGRYVDHGSQSGSGGRSGSGSGSVRTTTTFSTPTGAGLLNGIQIGGVTSGMVSSMNDASLLCSSWDGLRLLFILRRIDSVL